jgi:L-proline cis-4-hydroxylase
MRTQLLGQLDIDETRLQNEIERSTEFRYKEPYTEFVCGRPWKSCMLWAAGGEVGDNIITHYDTSKAADVTEYGAQLPYLRELIERSFAVEHLTFARLAVMSDSVLIPHRDYVELGSIPEQARVAHRLHVPLVTSQDCYFTEDDLVYRMKAGEVWFLDATRMHSAGVFSNIRRVHLILDFTDASDATQLVSLPIESPSDVPAQSLCPREPLSDRERDDLLALASVVDMDNLKDVFAIVIKKHYRRDGGENFVWNTLDRIAELSDNDAVRKKIHELHRYYVMERDE